LWVSCGYPFRVITKNIYSYPQSLPATSKVTSTMVKLRARLRVRCGYAHNHTLRDLKPFSPHRPLHSRPPLRAIARPPPHSIVASSRLCSPRTLACQLPQPSVVIARLRGCEPSASASTVGRPRPPPRAVAHHRPPPSALSRRRESLCAGMLVLKIENGWASLDLVTVLRLSLTEIYCLQYIGTVLLISEIRVVGVPNGHTCG
jgi:hypothetical protein